MVAFEQQRVAVDAAADAALMGTSVSIGMPPGPRRSDARASATPSRTDGQAGRALASHAAPSPVRSAVPLAGRDLAEAIEAALLPRLLMAHGGGTGLARRAPDVALADEVEPFILLLIGAEEDARENAALAGLQARGATVEALCLDLLAPAARRLGEMWEDDTCDFATLTLALNRLHRALHGLYPLCTPERLNLPVHPLRVALLGAAPGEQHVFGLAMVGEFLRSAGWQVHDAVGLPQGELAALARHHWFAVAAFSASRASGLEALGSTIRAVRAASCHRAIGILVGGRIFAEEPAAVTRVGADATAADARTAVAQAERLLARADSAARLL